MTELSLPTSHRFRNLTGQRFGRLVVVKFAGYRTYSDDKRRVVWECLCDCGNRTNVVACSLPSGVTKSCGCLNMDSLRTRCLKHGNATGNGSTASREYRIWQSMRRRCSCKSDIGYHRYGGRGIKVCDAWQNDFAQFLSDVGKKPGPGYSIDRIDNNGNYEPGNVQWATKREQAVNRRRTRWYTVDGATRCFKDHCDHYKLPRSTVNNRLLRGMTIEQALGLE